ncbi:MAG: OmpA family protein [Alphaproteobacteria bacterium]|nr:OmpA family protein [Alphaproteobacteria bacterium]
MTMMGMRQIIAATGMVALGLLAAGCTSSGGSAFSSAVTGATDDPASGFAKINGGTEEDFILSVGRRVYFRSGSADLSDVARETLDLQATWLNKHPRWLIKIQGHADDPGNRNVALSDRRAEAVKNYLAAKGVNPQRMWIQGYGTKRKVRDCADVSCKAQNRRVVVNLRTQFDDAAPQAKGTQG